MSLGRTDFECRASSQRAEEGHDDSDQKQRQAEVVHIVSVRAPRSEIRGNRYKPRARKVLAVQLDPDYQRNQSRNAQCAESDYRQSLFL